MTPKQRLFLGLTLFALIVAVAYFVIWLSPYPAVSVSLENANLAPSLPHLFGTDDLGRDLLTRTAEGVKLSLSIGLLAFLVDLLLGASVGTIAALSPSWLETILLRLIELMYSLPYLLVVILISVYTGQGIVPIFFAIVCIGWIHMAKTSYQLTKSSLVEGWATAALAIGVSKRRLLFHHIVPNIYQTLLATALIGIPQAIFTEAFLSFLGVGIPPPYASLGSMVADALPALQCYVWRLLSPSCTIILLIFSITLIQEALRDMFDPYLKHSHQ